MPSQRTIRTAYHLVDERNWASIQAHGLLSTNRLAAASGYGLRQLRLHRPKGLTLPSGVRIQDQSPMPPAVLGKYLQDGLSLEDWYDLLNSKVFFWLDPGRLNRQRRACGDAPQRVLVIDAARMLDKHGSRAAVTAINTGNAMRAAAVRGLSTSVPVMQCTSDGWAFEKVGRTVSRPAHKPVELMIADAVEDIMYHVIEIITLGAGQTLGADNRIVDER